MSATGSASAVESVAIQHWQSQWHTFSTGCQDVFFQKRFLKKSTLTPFRKFSILVTSRMNPRGWVCIGVDSRKEKAPRTAKRLAVGMEAGGSLRFNESASGGTVVKADPMAPAAKRPIAPGNAPCP